MISLKHAFTSAVPDSDDTSLVRPSNWNAEHVLTQATARLLGRATALDGETEELTAAQVKSLLAILAADISDFSTAADARISAAIGVTVQAYDADLAAWAGANPSSYSTTAQIAAAYQPLDADLTAIAALTTATYGRSLLTLANATALAGEVDSFFLTPAEGNAAYQPLDSDLTSWAGVTRASGFDTFAATPSSANLRSILSDEDGTGPALFGGSSYIREKLTGNRTYYVRTDGSNSNTGLVDSAGGAFLTIQKAIDTILGTLDLGGFNVTIQVRTGTFSGAISMASPQHGKGNITLAGDTTTPSNIDIATGGSSCITVDGGGCRLFVQGLKLSNTGLALLNAKNGGYISTSGKNEFGGTSGHRILAEAGGRIEATAAETVSGTASGAHYLASQCGTIYCQGAVWTASGTAAQSPFAGTNVGGAIYAFGNSSSGTFTGKRYDATLNGVIQTNGGGASYFPGSIAGTTATGGQYA